jgi:NADH-quinone oxidoreductase subunit E
VAREAAAIVAEGVERHGGGRGSVLMLLTDVNRELGYVPEEAMRAIARAAGVSTAQVQSIATFYSFISLRPRGRHIVRLCKTISCAMKGSAEVLAAVERELGIEAGQTTSDGAVTLETTSCLGLCDQSPAMLVDDTPHSGLTPGKACEIVRGLRKGGKA